MKRYRIFKVTTIKETNTRPIRIKIEDLWRGGHLVVGYSAEGASDRTDRAIEVLHQRGIKIVADAYNQDQSICFLLTTDFKTGL